VTRFWQRIIISIAVIGLAASSATVRPLRAAEENGQLKLARDYVDAMEIIRSNYVENVEYENLSKAAIQGCSELSIRIQTTTIARVSRR
jgi:hypothetical protein